MKKRKNVVEMSDIKEKIRQEYCSTQIKVIDLAAKYGIRDSTIRVWKMRHGWEKDEKFKLPTRLLTKEEKRHIRTPKKILTGEEKFKISLKDEQKTVLAAKSLLNGDELRTRNLPAKNGDIYRSSLFEWKKRKVLETLEKYESYFDRLIDDSIKASVTLTRNALRDLIAKEPSQISYTDIKKLVALVELPDKLNRSIGTHDVMYSENMRIKGEIISEDREEMQGNVFEAVRRMLKEDDEISEAEVVDPIHGEANSSIE